MKNFIVLGLATVLLVATFAACETSHHTERRNKRCIMKYLSNIFGNKDNKSQDKSEAKSELPQDKPQGQDSNGPNYPKQTRYVIGYTSVPIINSKVQGDIQQDPNNPGQIPAGNSKTEELEAGNSKTEELEAQVQDLRSKLQQLQDQFVSLVKQKASSSAQGAPKQGKVASPTVASPTDSSSKGTDSPNNPGQRPAGNSKTEELEAQVQDLSSKPKQLQVQSASSVEKKASSSAQGAPEQGKVASPTAASPTDSSESEKRILRPGKTAAAEGSV